MEQASGKKVLKRQTLYIFRVSIPIEIEYGRGAARVYVQKARQNWLQSSFMCRIDRVERQSIQ